MVCRKHAKLYGPDMGNMQVDNVGLLYHDISFFPNSPFMVICPSYNNITYSKLNAPMTCIILLQNVCWLCTKHNIKLNTFFITFFNIGHKVVTQFRAICQGISASPKLVPFLFLCPYLNNLSNILRVVSIQDLYFPCLGLSQIHTILIIKVNKNNKNKTNHFSTFC